MAHPRYDDSVFINCPFDSTYRPLFEAVVFATLDCGFLPRCALEVEDSGQVRIDKLVRIIRDCRHGIHDISYTELDGRTRLPRFNMPLELGLFLGARRFGDRVQAEKSCVVLDREPFRFREFISDIAGQDVRAHHGLPEEAVVAVRDYLRAQKPPAVRIPGGEKIAERYRVFRAQFPGACAAVHLNPERLTFVDLLVVMGGWLDANPLSLSALDAG